jgi:hypothetical protein
MLTKKCPRGQYYRKSYTRKTQSGSVRIPGTCLRSQTRYAEPYKVDRSRLRGYRMTKRALNTCPKGYIKRAAYVRLTKRGKRSYVPEQCVTDVGLPGKGYRDGPGIGALRKGELSKHGYANVAQLSVEQRHAALRKAIAEYGSLGVWRKLNAVSIYTKRTAPHISAIFKDDMAWIRTTFGIKAF